MLDIQGLSKRYPNGVMALNDVSLQVRPGIHGLLGPNGAGKSSLMRTLVCLQPPDAGTVMLDGGDLLADPGRARSMAGYLPQDFGLYPQVTASEMLDQFAVYKGIRDARVRRQLVGELLERVNLRANASHRLGGFSGGMRQRFGIAQALIGQPRLLVVDEPTAGLDPAERVRLQSLLAELGRDRIVLLSTHIVEDVMALCTDITVMAKGQVVAQGDLKAMLDAMKGRVWSRAVASDLPLGPLPGRQLSEARVLGVRHVRVWSQGCPGEGFTPAEPELGDIYFGALEDARPLGLAA